MKKIYGVALTMLLFGMSMLQVNVFAVAGKQSCDWSMFRHDLAHTGYSSSSAPNSGNVSWSFKTGGWVDSSPAIVGGRVYIGSYDGWIYCLNATTGQLVWSYKTNGIILLTSAAVVNGMVFVGSRDKKVYCLNATTGQLIWSFDTGSLVLSSPAITGGQVFIGSQAPACKVYCLNASNGAHIWNFTTGGDVNSSPAVVDGRVYVGASRTWGADDFRVYCLNATNGGKIWSYRTGSVVDSSPAVVEGRVYVGSDDYKIYCLNATTGQLVWSCETGYHVCSSPAVSNGRIYVGSMDNKVYCLNTATGGLIWSYKTSGDVRSSPAIADSKVFVGSDDGRLYVFGPPIHEIAIVEIKPSKTVVGQNYPVSVDVHVDNQGGYTETFSVRLYVNETLAGIEFEYDAPCCEVATVTFSWNATGWTKGNYTFQARATPLPDEPDTTDNWLAEGWVLVTVPGDVDGDRDVDIYDIVRMAGVYGISQPDPRYDPYCDIDGDGDIDIYDIVIAADNYGESW